MKPGRKKISGNIIAFEGNKSHAREVNHDEPQAPIGSPKIPVQLDALAKKIWKEKAEILVKLKVLSEIDDAIFAGFCQSYSWYLQLLRDIKKEGLCVNVYVKDRFGENVLDDKGKPIVDKIEKNPKLQEARLLLDKIRLTSSEFGLSASSRAGIKIPKGDQPGGIADFMQQGREINGG